jgi:DNA-binding transcriptional ArsR family regulator
MKQMALEINFPQGETEGPHLDAERLAEVCKALGHPARVRILKHLRRIDRCICGEIVEVLPLAQSTVSQHLKILKAAGMIRGEVEGPRTCYCIDKERFAAFKKLVERL